MPASSIRKAIMKPLTFSVIAVHVEAIEITEINVDDYLHLFRYATEEEKRQIEKELKESEERPEAKKS